MSNIQIVDAEDSLLDTKSYDQIDFKNDIYRITILWVVNGDKQPLVTKRDLPMLDEHDVWAPSVVGTVVDRETYRTNPLNEIKNQLGLGDVQLRAGHKQLFEGKRNYFCRWYLVVLDDEEVQQLQISDEIVSEMEWVTVEELKTDVAANPDKYVSTMEESVKNLEEMIAP